MQSETYNTIASTSEGLFKDRGSKFIAYAYPVSDELEIKDQLELLKKEHHNARHHCWAYKLGIQGEIYRANDDGEPSNSAGKPILGQIDSFDLTNTLVVVVRYFGGTLLGVGGLMQAYKESAKDALSNATIIQKTQEYQVSINCEYNTIDSVLNILKQNSCRIKSQQFETTCTVDCYASKIVIDQLNLISSNNTKITVDTI